MLEEEQAVNEALHQLENLLKENEIIRSYREIEARVKNNKQLDELAEKIRQAQKDAVQYAHYGKPEAEKQALAEADRLTELFDQHPLVILYRERLAEADDLIQHITQRIQKAVNDETTAE